VSCAASNEVKQASSQVGVALTDLRETGDDFRTIYLRELEETRQLVGRAVVADAVVRKVKDLSAKEEKGDLISISGSIKSQRDAYQVLVKKIMQAKPKEDQNPEDVVKAILKKRASALRKSAEVLSLSGKEESAHKLLQRAEKLETSPEDVENFGDMVVIVEIKQIKNHVREGMKGLDEYLQFLQMMHAQVNEWITSDVTVKGEDVAALIEKHAAVLGLKGSQGGDQ
jgi:tartrate dehydratase beta subunit/fumarate hydratase class I family protein